ncbi:TPA: hypothetical protein ACH3X1_016560 [Trebouxia sp. C0004]
MEQKAKRSRLVKSRLWRFAFHTGVQCCNTKARQHWSGQISFPAVLGRSAKQAHSMLVPLQLHLWRFASHTVTPLEICFSNRCAVMEKKRLRLLASIFMRNQVLYRAAQGARGIKIVLAWLLFCRLIVHAPAVRPSLCLA